LTGAPVSLPVFAPTLNINCLQHRSPIRPNLVNNVKVHPGLAALCGTFGMFRNVFNAISERKRIEFHFPYSPSKVFQPQLLKHDFGAFVKKKERLHWPLLND
jgi:hypothetical protein